MDWNEITNGIDHIAGKHITLSTDPVMKVDIDGEISLETPITIEVLPKALQILTFPENRTIRIYYTNIKAIKVNDRVIIP